MGDQSTHSDIEQTDTRMANIEVKVRKLDGELARYKEQMSKLRNGPGKVSYNPEYMVPFDLTPCRMQSSNVHFGYCGNGRCTRSS